MGANLVWPRSSVATPPSYTLAEMLNMARGSVDQAVHVNKSGVVKIDSEQPVDLFSVRLTLLPGKHTGWHAHPGVVLTVVEEGAVAVYDATCQRRVYDAGLKEFPVATGPGYVDPAICTSSRTRERCPPCCP